MADSGAPKHARPDDGDRYRRVTIVLLGLTATVAVATLLLGLGEPVLLDSGIALALASCLLRGVANAQQIRSAGVPPGPERPPDVRPAHVEPAPTAAVEIHGPAEVTASPPAEPAVVSVPSSQASDGGPASAAVTSRAPPRTPSPRAALAAYRSTIGRVGLVVVGIDVMVQLTSDPPIEPALAIGSAVLCVLSAAAAALAARYLRQVDAVQFPEAPALSRGARVLAWLQVAVIAAIGATWAGQHIATWLLHVVTLAPIAAACVELLRPVVASELFEIDLGVFSVLGSRPNILASLLDAGQRRLGIDLRSTWALTVVRRYVQPLVLGLLLIGWLSSSLTLIGTGEAGLIERFGVSLDGPALEPGIHAHWPWPVDRVARIAVARVRSLAVGHEGEEPPGPENVLWAQEHAANEYTLLLGDGRDLITIDASVQYRIRDPKAWSYRSQNPGDALRAVAYRAVMRATVNRTLADALSENVARLTAQIKAVVQREADAVQLGVDVVGFTIGGMHPPVMVARDYQAVVSAELAKVTTIVEARVFRNQTVPRAEMEAATEVNAARADGASARAEAAGEAWAFRALESQYTTARDEYRFRRRLETLENGLDGRRFTVVDGRIMRDGGELWLTQ
jgi:membrane protease subunit HflK